MNEMVFGGPRCPHGMTSADWDKRCVACDFDADRRSRVKSKAAACWIIKRGEEYLTAPHWRLWGDRRLVARFESREKAERYLDAHPDPDAPDAPPERVVKLVRKRTTSALPSTEKKT